MPIRVGCCITPHGFGHAARACAVMEALSARVAVHFEIVTTVPEWFFTESLTAPYTLHPINCDIGLVQCNSLEEDPGQTLELLDRFYPLGQALVDRVAALFEDCSLVICDIASLGIAAAQRAGIVSVLVENFTWDWIYSSYLEQWPGFDYHISYLQQLYASVDYHLQAEPVCAAVDCDLLTAPIARQRKLERQVVRDKLQVADKDTLVLVTMGGVPGVEMNLDRMAGMDQCFVLPGHAKGEMVVQGNLRMLQPDSGIYHPDLVAACDAVIGKVGYSTLAEVYQAGVPFGYICRPEFRESAPLAAFIDREMVSTEITGEQFGDGSWLDRVSELCRRPLDLKKRENGSMAAAAFLADLLSSQP